MQTFAGAVVAFITGFEIHSNNIAVSQNTFAKASFDRKNAHETSEAETLCAQH